MAPLRMIKCDTSLHLLLLGYFKLSLPNILPNGTLNGLLSHRPFVMVTKGKVILAGLCGRWRISSTCCSLDLGAVNVVRR